MSNPPDDRATPEAEMHAEAHDESLIFQAGRDQYIYQAPAPVSTASLRTLPRDIEYFTARETELTLLNEKIAASLKVDRPLGVFVIGGMPGIGKTALVIHAGHQLANGFPDGQLFLRMNGHNADVPPIEPTDALEYLLMATGVSAEAIPTASEPQATLEARAAMWRDRLTGKRLLLILDDAVGYEQVLPLLPSEPGCLVLITSRRRLPARPEFIPMPLKTLSTLEAVNLFTSLVGNANKDVISSDSLITRLVELCSLLPLAISLLAGRFINHPAWSLSDLVSDLEDAQNKLSHLYSGDLAVAAAFDLSFRRLPSARKRFLRRISLAPGLDIDVYAVAALNRMSIQQSADHLESLHNEYLLIETTPGRYVMHDLVREFARYHSQRASSQGETKALNRLLDYYIETTRVAEQQLTDYPRLEIATAYTWSMPNLSTRPQALRWLDIEHANIMACASHCIGVADDRRVVSLSMAVAAYLRHAGPWDSAETLHQAATNAAHALGDRFGEATALSDLGKILALRAFYARSIDVFNRSIEIYAELNDRSRQAEVLTKLGTSLYQLDDYPGAAEMLLRSYRIYADENYLPGQAEVLNELGILRFLAADYSEAADTLTRALKICRQIGNKHGEAWALNRLGAVSYKTGNYSSARPLLENALKLFVELGDRVGQSSAQNRLGIVATFVGDYQGAIDNLEKSLVICEDLGERLGRGNTLHSLGKLQRIIGEFGAAERTLRRCLDTYLTVGNKLGQADALTELGQLYQVQARYQEALTTLKISVEIYTELGDRQGEAVALNTSGIVLREIDQPVKGLDRHLRALKLASAANVPAETARAYYGAGRCLMVINRRREAAESLKTALSCYERMQLTALDKDAYADVIFALKDLGLSIEAVRGVID